MLGLRKHIITLALYAAMQLFSAYSLATDAHASELSQLQAWLNRVKQSKDQNAVEPEMLSVLASFLKKSEQSNHSEISFVIDVLMTEVRTSFENLDGKGNRWERGSKLVRTELDEKSINALHDFSHADVIAVFTDKLIKNKASVAELDELLAVLHIYLVPETGLRTIHLGLHHSDFKTLSRDARSEPGMNGKLDHEEKARSLQTNVAQAIENTAFLLAISEVARTQRKNFSNMKEPQVEAALMLTAVIFDLWEIHGLKHSSEAQLLKPALPAISDIGQVWDYKTCWRVFENKIPVRENRKEYCLKNALTFLDSAKLITAIEGRENGDIDQVEYQWGYAGAAIRMMNQVELPEWMQER